MLLSISVDIINCILYVLDFCVMKELFRHVWQRIIIYKKKIIYSVLALLVWQIFLFNIWGDWIQFQVYAEDEKNTQDAEQIMQQKVTDWTKTLSALESMIYILLYPIFLLAWALIDNSLVYWSGFWFDAILWNLWNVVKNLANFGLWFIFVYKIWEILIKQKQGDMKVIKELLTSVLIAWVWIQASWFIMAALIDVSTIAAYWIWWLPLSTLKEEQNPYVFQTAINVDAEWWLDSIDYYYTNYTGWSSNNKFYISLCETFVYTSSGWKKEELILSPSKIFYLSWNNEYKATETKKCFYDDKIYNFVELYTWSTLWSWDGEKLKDNQMEYKSVLSNAKLELNKKSENDVKTLIEQGKILQIWNAHDTWGVNGTVFSGISYAGEPGRGLDVDNIQTWMWKTKTLKEVLDTSWSLGYLWVFSTLFSSLVGAWINMRLAPVSSDNSTYVGLMNVAFSFWHMLAIWIPLIAMLIVLLLRIWVLWMAITLSPAIVLITAFKFDKKLEGNAILKHLTVKNLVWIIFSPVVVCFAVSLSTILMRIILALNWDKISTTSTPILGWLIEIDIAWLGMNLWKIICSIIWIVITRFLMWVAIKASSLWKIKVIEQLESTAKTTIWSMPIIPIPWKDGKSEFVWLGTVFWSNSNNGWIISQSLQSIKTTANQDSQNAVKRFANPVQYNHDVAQAYETKIVQQSSFNGNRWEESINLEEYWKNNFSQIKYGQQDIIQKINELDDKDKEKFKPKNPSDTISFKNEQWGTATYVWNAEDKKREPVRSSS